MKIIYRKMCRSDRKTFELIFYPRCDISLTKISLNTENSKIFIVSRFSTLACGQLNLERGEVVADADRFATTPPVDLLMRLILLIICPYNNSTYI